MTVARWLLFFSGLTALVYQTVWIKQLTLVVGVDVYAITTGVSAFFAGLALGSWVIGRLADRWLNPVALYAAVELGIAVLSVAATLALAKAPFAFVALQTAVGPLAWLLPFGLVAFPAMLMGGTLPPLLAAVKPSDAAVGAASGRLYAANTAGAIAGTLFAIFVLIPSFGIRGSAFLAAGINLILAVIAQRMARQAGGEVTARRASDHAPLPDRAKLALALYALAGAIAIGYEVVWTQVIVQFLSTRAMAFGIVLATYLTGLVIGSWVFSRYADRVADRWTSFAWLIGGAGVAAMVSFALLGAWLPEAQAAFGGAVRSLTGSRMLEMCARFILAAGFLVLPATLLLGAAFPAAARLIVQPEHAGRDVGSVLALNTACGIAGTVLTGFVLIPALGLARTLGLLAVAAVVIGGLAAARSTSPQLMKKTRIVGVIAVVAAAATLLQQDKLATLLAEERGGEVVYYDEGPAGTVAVIEQDTPKGEFRRLYIQGVSNSGDVMPSLRYMRLQALLPLLIHPGEPKSAAVIAFGTGITAGSLLAYPDLERRVAIELLRPVVDAAPLFQGNYGAGTDPRLEVIIADGRHELMRREETFDVITLEPPPPAAAGVVNLYSTQFYELANRRLAEGGLLAQWLPIATQNTEDTKSLVRSMLDVFPHVSLWTTEVHEMMLIGSMQPLDLDYREIEQRMQAPSTKAALNDVGINSAADLLATYITSTSGLETYVADARAVTDDRPRIEYAPWVRSGEILRVLPELLALSSPLPLQASRAEVAQVEESFGRLLSFYEAAYRSYSGDRATWADRRIDAQRGGEPNAYFDWFFGEN